MPSVSRRDILRLGSLGLAGSTAGCSALTTSSDPDESNGLPIGAVSVHNGRTNDVRISLLVIRDGDRLYWRTHELAGTETDGSCNVLIAPPTYEAGKGSYLIGVQVESTDESELFDVNKVLQAESDENDCFWVEVSLFKRGDMALGNPLKDEGVTNCSPTTE